MNPSRVSELMRICPAAVIADSTPLRTAAEILVLNDYSLLVAVDQDGYISGVVPEAAVIRQLMTTSSREQTLANVLSRHVESVRANAEINSILHLFRASCHSAIPVIGDDDQVVGLLHRNDIVKMLLDDGSTSNTDTPRMPQRKPHFLQRPAQSSERPSKTGRNQDK